MAESVANELVLSSMEHQSESSKNKLKDSKTAKAGRSLHEEKKTEKSLEDKKSRPQKLMQFQTIKISQVCHKLINLILFFPRYNINIIGY